MSEKHKVEFAVMFPVYNHADFLDESLRSVLEQKYNDFVVVVSDDCSADNSVEIIRRFQKQDSRIILLTSEKNLGANENMNKMLEYIRDNIDCKFITFTAGDDILYADALTVQKRLMNKHVNAGVMFSPSDVINNNGSYQLKKKIIGKPKVIHEKYHYDTLLKDGFMFSTNCSLIKKSALLSSCYSGRYAADFNLFIDVVMSTKCDILYSDRPLGVYRRHAGGITSNIHFRQLFIIPFVYYLSLIIKYPRYTLYSIKNMCAQYLFGGMHYIKNKMFR